MPCLLCVTIKRYQISKRPPKYYRYQLVQNLFGSMRWMDEAGNTWGCYESIKDAKKDMDYRMSTTLNKVIYCNGIHDEAQCVQ